MNIAYSPDSFVRSPPVHVYLSGRLYLFLSIVFSGSYALFLAGLPMDRFADRDNYINYVMYSVYLVKYYLGFGVATLLSNEPAWLLLNACAAAFFEPEVALRLIIFGASFIFSFFLMQNGKGDPKFLLFAICICLLPQVMKNYVVHLRQGVAITIAMVALTSLSVNVRRIGILVAPFVHSSYFFLFHNFLLSALVQKNKRFTKELAFWTCFLTASLIALICLSLLSFVDARQVAQYQGDLNEPRSGAGFVFWLIVLLIFLFEKVEFRLKNLFALASIAVYLVLYFLFDPVARVFESALPFVLLASYELEKKKRLLFFFLFGFIFVYQWLVPFLTGGSVFALA